MAADAPNHAGVLDMEARLARPAQVRPAAATKPFLVHVGAVVPAAFALRVGAWFHSDVWFAFSYTRRRSDEQELELIVQAREELVVFSVRRIVDFRLQRRAELVLRPQRFDAFAHRVAELAQTLPLGQQPGGVRRSRQLVPGVEEHAVVALA